MRRNLFSARMMMGTMEIVDFNAYDLKHLSSQDVSYNPALGSGQLQVRDFHFVTFEWRTTRGFCQLLDLKSSSLRIGYLGWLGVRQKGEWIKDE